MCFFPVFTANANVLAQMCIVPSGHYVFVFYSHRATRAFKSGVRQGPLPVVSL